jgi:DNA-binding transcriptional ArsR family regulator
MISQMNVGEEANELILSIEDPKPATLVSEERIPLKIDYLNVKKAALVLRALNHKLRQQMIQTLDAQGKMTVTEIYVQLRLEQSVASQHLAILRRAGIVRTDRDGKFVYYRINPERVDTINACVHQLTK